MKKIYLPLFLTACMLSMRAQTFTAVTGNIITQNSLTSWGNSWIDYDGDNDLDLFVNDKDQHRLYRNDGNGNFTDVTPTNLASPAPLGFYYTTGWGDYNNDGFIDLYMGNDGDKNALFTGTGVGTFTQVTAGPQVTEMHHTFNCNWVDYNNDGFLDLFAGNVGTGSTNEKNDLYRNNGGASFTKITTGNIVNDLNQSWAYSWCDFNNDRCPDLFVGTITNDYLYKNNCDGTFTKITAGTIVNDGKDSESASWGDYNNDGFMDLFVNVWGDKSMLYKNNGDETFTKILAAPFSVNVNSGTGSGWADYDNDGDLDLYTCTWNNEKNRMYENNDDGTFTEITTGPLVNDATPTNGCTWADYDNDGDQDLYVTNKGAANQLFRNSGNNNHWVNIRCKGITSNALAIGAKVRVKATINGVPKWQMREIGQMTGQFAQTGMNAAFGFGNATVLDSVKVEWPSGATCTFTNVLVDKFITIDETCALGYVGIAEVKKDHEFNTAIFPNPFNSSTTISYNIKQQTNVSINITDALGRQIINLVNESHYPGKYNADLDASVLNASGVYFYTIKTDYGSTTGKLIYTGK